MKIEIIEILQKAYPEHCLHHYDTADKILRLFNVIKSVCDKCGEEKFVVEYCGNEKCENYEYI